MARQAPTGSDKGGLVVRDLARPDQGRRLQPVGAQLLGHRPSKQPTGKGPINSASPEERYPRERAQSAETIDRSQQSRADSTESTDRADRTEHAAPSRHHRAGGIEQVAPGRRHRAGKSEPRKPCKKNQSRIATPEPQNAAPSAKASTPDPCRMAALHRGQRLGGTTVGSRSERWYSRDPNRPTRCRRGRSGDRSWQSR